MYCCCYPALPFKFVEGLKDTEAMTSQDVSLACVVSKDDVELTWKKNGQEIKPDGKKYEVVHDGTTHRLVIHEIQLDDDAEYQCCFGDDLSSCKLHVEGNLFTSHFAVSDEFYSIEIWGNQVQCQGLAITGIAVNRPIRSNDKNENVYTNSYYN